MPSRIGAGERLRSIIVFFAAACGLLLTWVGPASAQGSDAATRSTARKLALEGIAALEKGDAEQAAQKLEKSYGLFPVPSVALWSARALVKRGLLVEASERYREATRMAVQPGEAAVQRQSRDDAASELEELSPRIPALSISVEGASATSVEVTLDGVALPPALLGEERSVNPGKHRVLGKTAGQKQDLEVTLAEAEKKTVTLRFEVEPRAGAAAPERKTSQRRAKAAGAAARSPTRTLSYVALSVGGAGLLVGSVTGYLALRKRNSLDESDDCRGDRCLLSKRGEVDQLRTLRTVSSVAFLAGGALAATGLVLTFSSGPREAPAAQRRVVTLAFAGNSVDFSGTF